jgi:hypothetical protein
MDPGEPLITVELWRRLRAFDPYCHIEIERRNPPGYGPFQHYPRVWIAKLRPVIGRPSTMEGVWHPQFAEAIRLLIERGEAKGWNRGRCG